MSFEDSHRDTIPVQLPNGASIKFEVTKTGREDVSFEAKQFQPIAEAIEGIVKMIAVPIQKSRPKKASVKFGMEMAIDSGKLTAVIVQGYGKANLEITLEWERPDKDEP